MDKGFNTSTPDVYIILLVDIADGKRSWSPTQALKMMKLHL